jgi:hypothetical protein
MNDLSRRKLRGSVHLLRKERAPWDEVHNV